MQNVYNRDNFIRFNKENLNNTEEEKNFEVYPKEKYDDLGFGYDYNSILHYKRDAFAKENSFTITSYDIRYLDNLGEKEKMSEIDVKKLNIVYECQKVWDDMRKKYDESKQN